MKNKFVLHIVIKASKIEDLSLNLKSAIGSLNGDFTHQPNREANDTVEFKDGSSYTYWIEEMDPI